MKTFLEAIEHCNQLLSDHGGFHFLWNDIFPSSLPDRWVFGILGDHPETIHHYPEDEKRLLADPAVGKIRKSLKKVAQHEFVSGCLEVYILATRSRRPRLEDRHDVLFRTLEGLLNTSPLFSSLLWRLSMWDTAKDVLESIAGARAEYPDLFGGAAMGSTADVMDWMATQSAAHSYTPLRLESALRQGCPETVQRLVAMGPGGQHCGPLRRVAVALCRADGFSGHGIPVD